MNKQLKKNILNEVYNHLKDRGYKNLKSDFLETESPNKVVEKQSGQALKPDLTATYKSSAYIFKIETAENIEFSKESFIDRCNAFLRYANSKNGKFKLIVPVQQFDQVFSEVNKNNLENVGILQIDGAIAHRL